MPTTSPLARTLLAAASVLAAVALVFAIGAALARVSSTPRLRDTPQARDAAAAAVAARRRRRARRGDWVLADSDHHGGRSVVARVPPRDLLPRCSAERLRRQVIVANVDTALLASSLDDDVNFGRIDRDLAFVRMAGVGAIVVLTKADPAGDTGPRVAEVRARLRPGERVFAVDAPTRRRWRRCCRGSAPGTRLVLLGSSGVGNSTLTNALTRPGASDARASTQATGAPRCGGGRGRRTTTACSLHVTPSGACINDTPGLRTLRLDGDERALRDAFDDVERLATKCRLRDCTHGSEPGCAVRDALSPEQLANWHKLLREVQRHSMGALERRSLRQRLQARSRVARAHQAAKGR